VNGRARLVYFDRWLHDWSNAEAGRIFSAIERLDLIGLRSDASDANKEMIRAHGYQILPRVEMKGPWLADRALIHGCPSLLAVCTTGSGYDVVDVDACTEAGVIVCNQAGGNKEAVAEHALGMMLALTKKIGLADKLIRRQRHVDRLPLQGRNLHGKTLGIIGIGQIGSRLAEICGDAFNMKVLAYDPYLSAAEIRARGAAKVDLDELFRLADFVSVHCPRTKETMGMIGRRQFEAMQPTAFFITTARGGIHVEDDLVTALAAGRIAGAGIDVFLEEPPPPDHRLLTFDNVVATPHIAGTTAESVRDMAINNALQWADIFQGRRPPRLVNPQAWEKYTKRFETLLGFRPNAAEQAGRDAAA
jgi:D-3-phosphoglycerate dehydrogenase